MRTRVVMASAADARKARLLEPLAAVADVSMSADPAELKALLPDAEVLVVGSLHEEGMLAEVWPHARRLRWVHSLSAGVEGILFPGLADSDVVLTNSRGVFKRPLAEFALLGMLMHFRRVRALLEQQRARRWSAVDVEMLRDKVMGVVGYGEIGRECARLGHALGMRIHALRRNPGRSAGDPIIERAFTARELPAMLAGADVLLCAAPLTRATRHLISGPALAALKPGAFVINVGRGPVIDEAELIKALRTRRIAGAALDVFEQEPLPAESPLWGMENVLLSPHSADNTIAPDSLQLTLEFFVRNFHHYRSGEPLENVVDKREGY